MDTAVRSANDTMNERFPLRTAIPLLRRSINIPFDIHRSSMYRTVMLGKDLVAASSKPMVLSIIAERETYGYEIIQKVRNVGYVLRAAR